MAISCDVLVVGGGPAGAGLAFLLAKGGVRTVLVERGQARPSGPFETVLPAARGLLVRCGLDDVVAAAAEPDPLRHGAVWGSGALEWRAAEAGGLLLRRGPFDAALRRSAAERGAVVYEGARVTRDASGLLLVRGCIAEPLEPRVVVHATGRGGPRRALGPGTIAYTFVGEPDPGDRGTAVVEAVAAGWSWTHVPRDGTAACAWFLEARLDPMARRAALAHAFAAAVGPAGRLRAARLCFATDATPTVAVANSGGLAIGDAAATADPLSSQGVEKALAAAEHAAAVVRTMLAEPAWSERLMAVHRRWEAGLAAAHRTAALAWYAREDRFVAAPFWAARRVDLRTSAPPAPELAFRAAPTLVAERILVREGDRFAMVDGIRDTVSGDERSHIGYVPIAPLLRVCGQPIRLDDAVRVAGREPRLFVLPPRAVHAAIRELVRIGWLVPVS
ncbi:MAG: FAD-dependent monooxygenase [Planctomycetes bacterium]|nr:FAD-dependent monooxygenase [Planctomycetota bacterium]